MVVVIHYAGNKDPDTYFGITEKTESRILNDLKKSGWKIARSDPKDWYGQDNPRYPIHHWECHKG